MDDKIIVTNRGALRRKYAASGVRRIEAAVRRLIAADRKRGLKTRTIHLDDAAVMKTIGGKPVGNVADCRATKRAVDAVFRALAPDYVLILGAPDVVAHQDLDNAAYSPPDDDDRPAWGDLPYCCEAAYARDSARFVGPTRVVARLPDLTGAKEPSHLLALLDTATHWRSRPPNEFDAYFGLSAEAWKGSTGLSLDSVFGNHARLLLAPPKGPKYPSSQLRAAMHFINCHGGPASPEFYGQKGKSYPVALTTAATSGTIGKGTLAAVECCYGAQLYDARTLGIDVPICQSYLRQGSYGYFGSTTIAYGPADDNGAADLICQYFLLNVLAGASIGRAALMARQQFVEHNAQMDPIDLKTLAQFCLYGDPSVHPVDAPVAPTVPKGVAAADAQRFFRSERRAKLRLNGRFLEKTKPTASKAQALGRLSASMKRALGNIASAGGLPRGQGFRAYKVEKPAGRDDPSRKTPSAPSRYLVAMGRPARKTSKPVRLAIAVIAKEVAGRVVGYRVYHQR